MRLASSSSSTGSANATPLSATGWPSSKRIVTRLRGLTATSSRQNATPMIGSTIFDALVEVLEVLGLVRRAQHVGVGRVRLLHAHLVGEARRCAMILRHLLAAAELVDERLVEPGLVDAQRGIGEQAVAVEALDVVALEGAAVAPDVDVVFLHGDDEHRAGDGAADRRGVEVGHAGGRDVEGAGLQRGDALRRRAAARQSIRRACSAPYCSARRGISS